VEENLERGAQPGEHKKSNKQEKRVAGPARRDFQIQTLGSQGKSKAVKGGRRGQRGEKSVGKGKEGTTIGRQLRSSNVQRAAAQTTRKGSLGEEQKKKERWGSLLLRAHSRSAEPKRADKHIGNKGGGNQVKKGKFASITPQPIPARTGLELLVERYRRPPGRKGVEGGATMEQKIRKHVYAQPHLTKKTIFMIGEKKEWAATWGKGGGKEPEDDMGEGGK